MCLADGRCALAVRYDCLHLERGAELAGLQLQGGDAGLCCLIELTPR